MILIIFSLLILQSCFDSGEGGDSSTGGGLFVGHKEAEDVLVIQVPADGTYVEDSNLDFVITHPFNLTITGTPRIELTIGTDTVYADYLTGNGTSNLTFRYTVAANNLDEDGIELTGTVDLNGGSIQYSNKGQVSDATTSITSLPNISGIRVDTVGPELSVVLPPDLKTYYLDEQLDFVATMTETTIVSGTPRISLNIGGTTRYANYVSGSGSSTLIFRYNVQDTDLDLNGIDASSPVQLNGGSLRDPAGNNATLSFTDGNVPGLDVDGDSPFVASFMMPANGTYTDGDQIAVELTFSENVDVAGGTPSIDLTVGSNTYQMTYASGTGTDTLRFRWTVPIGEYDNDGVEVASGISLNGATIRDGDGNEARLTIAVPLTPNVLVDSRLPQVTAITPPSNNTYIEDDQIDFLYTFSEAVAISGTPRLALSLESGTVYAEYVSGSGSNAVTFLHTVQAGDTDTNGITFLNNSIDLNGGSIIGMASGNNANLDFSAYVPADMTGILVGGDATQLVMTQEPTNTIAGQNINPAITVEIRDASNTRVNTATNAVTLSFGTDASAGAATLGGTLTVNAVAGVATFNDINIDRAFNGYTLSASSGSLTSDTSSTFDITPAPKSELAFYVQPSNAEVDASISPDIEVEILDAYGNRTADTDNITLAIANDPAGGSTLNGTLSVNAVNGVASFNDININLPGSGFTLDASAAGLTSATSSSFDINAVPTQLAITTQPSDTGQGLDIAPAIVIEIRDASNNIVTSANNTVNVAFGTDPSGSATLGGTLSVAVVNGVATFSDLDIDTVDTGFTLDFTSTGLTGATSNAFDITPVPTQLLITQQPTDANANTAIAPAITVELRDASNNLVTSATNDVTVSFNTDPSGGATLGGTLTVATVAGVATFSDLEINNVDTGYILDFASTGLTGATSNPFDILTPPATQLVITQEPSNTLAGENITAITVELRDASNNLVTGETSDVTVSFGTDPSGGNATLGGTLTVAAVGGIATFSDINIDKAFDNYILSFASTGLTGASSSAFNITPNMADHLGFNVQPSNADMDAVIAPIIEVEILDAYDNRTTDTDTVTMVINNNPSGLATLGGTVAVAAVNGLASFNDLTIDYAGTGYTLDATAVGLKAATSNSFNINSVPSQLVITTQPSNTDQLAVITPSITVEIRDDNNVLVSDATNTVTLAFGNDASGGSAAISGTTSQPAVSGVATFNDISIDEAGTAYTFTFTSAGLTSDTSNAFNIDVAIPTVTIDALSAINLNNHTGYIVTGTCSENTRTVTLNIGGVAATPTCSGGTYNSGAIDVSGVADAANVLITADHDNAAATPAVQAQQNVVKDTDPPSISTNNIVANTYNPGETIQVSVVFDQVVNVTGLPRLELFFEAQASANIYATYNGGSGTNTLVFDYTVAAGDADSNGISAAANLDLNSGTLRDVNGNNAVLTLAAADYSSVFADSAVPSIVEFIEPIDGTYPDGVGILFQVNFNEAVNITGNPRVTINVGGSIAYANYKTGTGTTGLEFEYIVQPGDSDLDGITFVSTTIDLNGGTVRGLDADDAVLDYALYADSMTGVIVDTATGVTPPDQVTGLTAAPTTSNTELALSWAVPADNGTAITNYAVQYREQGQSTWITLNPSPLTNSTTVTGLTAGITYEFRVTANNGLIGPFSATATAEIFDILSLDPVAWLDATNVNGNGTSPADGVKVANWVELTGAASNATEGNVANQPVMEYNSQNGLPAVRFDDNAVGLEGTFTRNNGTDLTFVIVGQFDNGYNDKCLFEFREGGGGNARGFFIDRRYAANSTYNPALTKGSFQLWRIENDGPNAVITENSSTEIFNGGILFNTDFTGTGNYVLGDDTTGGNRMYGYIAEFLIFDRQLTAQEIATLEQYLKNKWGTP